MSLFRPRGGVDQSVLAENAKLLESIDRRKVLRGTLSLGALTMLTGCDVTNRSAVQGLLTAVSSWNDRAQALHALGKLRLVSAPSCSACQVNRLRGTQA